MRGIDLRAARQRLGATQQRIAEASGVRTDEVESWESFGEVPRKHRFAVDMALWQIECEQALARSGLPQCEVTRAWEERPWEVHVDEIAQHVTACSMCTAREEYARENLRPAPIGPHPLQRMGAAVSRLPGWMQSAAIGVLAMLMVAGVGVLVMLGQAVLSRELIYVGYAAALLALLVVGGAAGGIVHYLTAAVRRTGTIGYYASYVATVYGYLLAVFGMLALAAPLPGEGGAADDLAMLSDPAGWVIMLIMSVIFGSVLGRSLRQKKTTTSTSPPKRRLLNLRNIGIVVVFLGGIVLRFFAEDEAAPTTPHELEAALPGLEAAVREDPANVEALAQLASALGGLGRWEESREVLQQAVRLRPDDPGLLHTLGWVTTGIDKPGEAIPFLKRASEIDPTDPRIWQNLAVAHYLSGQMAEAELAYRSLIQTDPAAAAGHGGLAWALLNQGRLSEAERAFREAVRLDPSAAGFHRGLATALMQSGRPQEALASYRDATRLTPEDATLWRDIGRLAHLAGEHDESVAAFARVNELDPSYFTSSPEAHSMWEASRAGRQFQPSGD